jgi:hypothetical protein
MALTLGVARTAAPSTFVVPDDVAYDAALDHIFSALDEGPSAQVRMDLNSADTWPLMSVLKGYSESHGFDAALIEACAMATKDAHPNTQTEHDAIAGRMLREWVHAVAEAYADDNSGVF